MEQFVNFIIRPPRAEYDPKTDLLDQEFMLKGKWFQRKDVEIKNSHGYVLQCTHYMPIVSPEGKPLPCVIYCHGNSGCRADASEAAMLLLPSNITVFALDFSGSGMSGGEHVTLGWNEKDDLRDVVNYLRADGNVSLIGLWGRSMGAVTCLMYGAEDPSIAGMVLDSPFSDLVDLMMELVDTYRFCLPKFTVKFAIQYMRRTIQKKAKFDIMDLNTLKVAKSCFVPALIGHAIDDDFIRPHHSDRILKAYMGDKNIFKFEGDHNSPRPPFYFDSINFFFHNVLQPPEDEVWESFFDFDIPNEYFGEEVWRSMHEVGSGNGPSPENKEPSRISTVDAMKQVRSKRPMCRMEEEKCDDISSSSSAMISFELSNNHPHVLTTLDDDQYVEYQFDDLPGFPSSARKEERISMEAVKDKESRNREVDQPPTSNVSTMSVEPSDKYDSHASSHDISKPMETESSLLKHNMHSTAETISTASNSISAIHSQNLEFEPSQVPSLSSSGAPPSMNTSSVSESCNTTSASALCHSSASIQFSTYTDISHNTKATLTVVRNPSGHAMNRLIRRWDFNFFGKSIR